MSQIEDPYIPQESVIGHPVHFSEGQFEGYTIRADLTEIQGSDFGRRYGVKDRRGLNESPVVLLRLSYVDDSNMNGEHSESEVQNYDDINVLGFICMVDLFRLDPQLRNSFASPTESICPRPFPTPSITSIDTPPISNAPILLYSPSDYRLHNGLLMSPNFAEKLVGEESYNPPTITSTLSESLPSHGDIGTFLDGLSRFGYPSDTIHFIDNYAVTESAKCTQALVGSTFIEPHHVSITLDGQQRRVLAFVFHDLAVQLSGFFVMRFRFFDLSSRPTGFSTPIIQAECYGHPFQMYSTRKVPKLKPSSELTRTLYEQGVPVLYRKKSRTPKRKHTVSENSLEASSEASDWEAE
ncbi:velvet factor-domain-containing protein [Mycena capillaripes]|nr:velvet factor-domain-containing protein [Mycena capillaripes]